MASSFIMKRLTMKDTKRIFISISTSIGRIGRIIDMERQRIHAESVLTRKVKESQALSNQTSYLKPDD
ncbi:hypothetical protein SDJN02_09489, partial [Cucurbita argyrosperma subsp. argyrosperma]